MSQTHQPYLASLSELVQQLEDSKGQWIQIDEAITQSPGNYNRHFTSFGRFAFELQYAGVRISGARLMIHGPETGYEISTGHLQQLDALPEKGWEITERLAESVERKTVIRFREKP
jgi:hypothetical protein